MRKKEDEKEEEGVERKTVLGQNGSRQNGTDKIVWTKWYG